jgi:hypothetical protein
MRTSTRQRSGETTSIEPPGSGGLNLNDDPVSLAPDMLALSRNTVAQRAVLARRAGEAKVSRFSDPTAAYGSKVLGASSGTKYARFTPPAIPRGGFAIKWALTAAVPAATTVYYWSSWTSAAATHYVVSSSLSALGLYTVRVEWETGGTATCSTTLVDGTTYTFLFVYDAVVGTLTLYRDGAQVAQTTGLASTLQPRQDASVSWYLGVDYVPGTGVTAGTGANAAMAGFTCFAFRGADITAGYSATPGEDRSILGELRAGTFQEYGNPASRMVLWSYSMREANGNAATPMVDASRFKGHGAYVGTPATAAGLVWPAQNGNAVLTVRGAVIGALTGGVVNVAACGGAAYYQQIEARRSCAIRPPSNRRTPGRPCSSAESRNSGS